MGKGLAVMLILVCLTSSLVIADKPVSGASSIVSVENTWVSKASMNTARANLGVVAVNGEIYAIGGDDVFGLYNQDQGFYAGLNGGTVNTNEEYNPITDSWIYKAPMSTARESFAVAVYQSKIYCIGGLTSVPFYGLNTQVVSVINEVYNTANNTWQTKASLPSKEWPIKASVVNGLIYVISHSGETYAYNPANDSWVTKSKAPSVNKNYDTLVTAVLDGKIYVEGLSLLNQVYDPLKDSWSILNSTIPYHATGLQGYATFEVSGDATTGISTPRRIYVFSENQTGVYNPANDSWTYAATTQLSNRAGYGVAVVNDTFYAIGGGIDPQRFFDTYYPSARNDQYFPIGYGTPDPSYVLEHTPPIISIQSPANQTYDNSSVQLFFIADKAVNWTGYSLDGQQNVTLTGNTFLTGLPSGSHSITVYANDTYGNMGASETIHFIIAKSEFFPIVTVAAVSVVTAVVVAGLLVFFKKQKTSSVNKL